ncbi:Coiled-coil domain-containing protein C1orf110-like [Acipenser ruthenus]|uniref:Coiled-coil domain-containing protein C1orf110-like n=1 Tax=Acipenser ruthenus TaxID=7906 RepID=A0A662YRJ8_ACIRT|nr:Coiled-coil domain-containing protein C1orf110-like [Acipenser ruthenus]
MQRSRVLFSEAEMSRRSEAEDRDAKRVEARLLSRLHRLDGVRLYHVNTMAREQRRIQRDLSGMRQGSSCRSSGAICSDYERAHRPPGAPKRAFLPTIPSGATSKPDGLGSQKLMPLRGGGQAIPAGLSHTLQARINKFIGVGGGKGGSEPVSVAMAGEGWWSEDSDGGVKCSPDPRRSVSLPPVSPLLDPSRLNLDALAPDGSLRTLYTLPSFSEALAEAGKARYIRHRGIPDSERELSIQDIFSRAPEETAHQPERS